MTGESLLIENVGLRHVFEDGISILSGNTIAPERRAYVIDNLWETFHDAKIGSDFASKGSLTYNSATMDAFQTFSLLDRFLRRSGDPDWREKLPIVENVFSRLKKNIDLSEEHRIETIAFLGKLVNALRRECGIF